MNILTYIAFTLLSIFIQFSVMDYLQDDENKRVDLNITSSKIRLNDIKKDLLFMPLALYYHSANNSGMNNKNGFSKVYRNTSLSNKQQSSTDVTSTMFDLFLYLNTSTTEGVFTTDSEYTSIGFDNITEVALFMNKNKTSQSDKTPPIKYNYECNCNFLYEACDINCCCDSDCDDSHKEMFHCMNPHRNNKSNRVSDFCLSHIPLSSKSRGYFFDDMFCIVKTNLPEHRNIIKNDYDNIAADDLHLKWQQSEKPMYLKEFTKRQYKIGDPVWLLQNTSIYHMDLPTSTVNKYCGGRKPITFLKDEVINCIVKYRNLEMFLILKTAKDSMIISATNVTANSTTLNCTNLHCTNVTTIVCDGVQCASYNENIHQSLCNEHTCTNIALTMDYLFYYSNSKLANVSVILHIQNVSTSLTFFSQTINLKFLLGNKTDEQVIEYSGSPGYRKGLMLVVSFGEGNYTNHFYHSKLLTQKYLSLPMNVNGQCVLPNAKQQFIRFGLNKRSKCRYFHSHTVPYKTVNVCKYIQGNISDLFRLNDKIVISPYGNPYNLKDEDWIHLNRNSLYKNAVFGKLDTNLYCFNVISKISLTFAFMNVNHADNNTIMSLNITISTKNISFTTFEQVSTIVTTDINFVNVSKRPIVKYAGSPHFNVKIPKDFFFLYPSNNSYQNKYTFNLFISATVLICLFLWK